MSFNTALSGLQAARADLDVTANNIANANTTDPHLYCSARCVSVFL